MGLGLKVEMFGWLRAEAGASTITHFRTRKTSALFGYLAFHNGRSHPREILAEMLWPGARGSASRNSLSQALTSLRQSLVRAGAEAAELLQADRNTVRLQSMTDVAEFEATIGQIDGSRDARIGRLQQAVQLYRGEFLPSHYEDWILAERTRLRETFLQANHELVTLLRNVGRLRDAIAAAHRAAREDPLSEQAVRDLMLSHAEAREPHLALRAYQELAQSLEREVGERPSAETRELARRISTVTTVDAPDAPPAELRAAPVSTITCLATRIELPPRATSAWAGALATVRARLKSELARYDGKLLRDENDALSGAFADPIAALDCAVEMREVLHRLSWPDGSKVSFRGALATLLNDPRHGGPEVCARAAAELLSGPGAPDSLLLSDTLAGLLRHSLQPGLALVVGPAQRIGHAYELIAAAPVEPLAARAPLSLANAG